MKAGIILTTVIGLAGVAVARPNGSTMCTVTPELMTANMGGTNQDLGFKYALFSLTA